MSDSDSFPAPPFDTEVAAVLPAVGEVLPPTVTPDMITVLREAMPFDPTVDATLAEAGVEREDFVVQGYRGDAMEVSVLRRTGSSPTSSPCVYYAHGGGMILGNRFRGLPQMLPWVTELGAIVVTVEYRLAPEFPDPYPVEDCYAGLVWTTENADRLGIDRSHIVIAGPSAGGGLAAGSALMSRDRRGPALAGQCLIYPMLDDRAQSVSTAQIDGIGVWDRTSNVTGWAALLGARRGTDDVSPYSAPARATDLSSLPPAYIDCGSAEVFRDEDVAYATSLWRCGVQAELHVFPGGFHGFDQMAPCARLSQAMVASRNDWLRLALAG